MNKQGKNGIGWCDYTWNPVTGCLNDCSYCYARRIATRFKGTKAWPNGVEPTFHLERLWEPDHVRKPSKIFVCSVGELFGDWVPIGWISFVLGTCAFNPRHTFQFLTKQEQNLNIFSPYPPNCWIGISVDGRDLGRPAYFLKHIGASVKFISFEPLLSRPSQINLIDELDWLIIGAQTNPYRPPKVEWVEEIVEAADRASIPVFLKDNLFKAYPDLPKRQEFPNV